MPPETIRTIVPLAENGSQIAVRVRGRVQGVGFRPHVWRLCQALPLEGDVRNDGDGVLIRLRGPLWAQDQFLARLVAEAPPLAAITGLEAAPDDGVLAPGFHIVVSHEGEIATDVSPDFALCLACRTEMATPGRRQGYAFTTCTHCGPRFTITRALPYDRARTTLAPFPLCAPCREEYENPADRRFHAEATACPVCGPRLVFERWDGGADDDEADPVAAAAAALHAGAIVAVKGLGGYQLACDATNAATVARLRALKRREGKPFALLVADLAAAQAFCAVSPLEADALASKEAPIVLLTLRPGCPIAPDVAPGLARLGVMLAANPLHVRLCAAFSRPLVMTSGNLSGGPQIIEDDEARAVLGQIAAAALVHDRAIANRIDDSVAFVAEGGLRLIRRGRGFAPASFPLPPGFENAPDLLAFGADLKSAFAMVSRGRLVLSQHQGDLDDPATDADFSHNLALYRAMFDHAPRLLAADAHPGYRAHRRAREVAEAADLPLTLTWHHHAHFAATLGEHGHPLAGPPALGLIVDGLGLGDDGTLWGAEVLHGDYRAARRLGGLRPVAVPGGDMAAREPWRNLFAQLLAAYGPEDWREAVAGLAFEAALLARPLDLVGRMIATGLNAPHASSGGRLFDAVAAAVGAGFDRQSHEGAAAMRLEAMMEARAVDLDRPGYLFALQETDRALLLDPAPMWPALLADLRAGVPAGAVSARFHQGFAEGLVRLALAIADQLPVRPDVLALSGGCFQNRHLLESVAREGRAAGFSMLLPAFVPANDGGLAFGQALIAAAINSA